VVAFAAVFIALADVVSDFGLSEALIQRKNINDRHLSSAFAFNAAASISLAAIVFFGSESLADYFSEAALRPILQVLSGVVILNAFSFVPQALLRREFRFRALAVRAAIATVLSGMVALVLAVRGYGLWSLVGLQLTYSATSALVLWSSSGWRPSLRIDPSSLAELFRFAGSVFVNRLLDFAVVRANDLLIGTFLGTKALGFYSIGIKLHQMANQLLIGTVMDVMLSAFSRMQADKQRLLSAYHGAIKYTSMVTFPLFLGLALVAPEFVPVVFGDQWIPSVVVVQALAILGTVQSVQYFNGNALKAMGRPDLLLITVVLRVFLVFASFAITYRWGIGAVAIGFLFANLGTTPLSFNYVRRMLPVRWSDLLSSLYPAVAGVVALGVCVTLVRRLAEGVLTQGEMLAASIVAGTVAYVSTLYFIAPSTLMGLLRNMRSARP
jgi:PST family polysaccharide transporter